MTHTGQPPVYYRENSEAVLFLDLVYGTELDPDAPPPSVIQDAFASAGLEKLHQLAAEQRLTVQFIQNFHAAGEDFHDMIRVSGRAIPLAKLVGIEMAWKPIEVAKPHWGSVEYQLSTFPARRAFQDTQLGWLRERNKVIIPCEYPTDHSSELGQRFEDVIKLFWEAKKKGDARTATILYGCYQTTRQWLFLAALGWWLRRLEEDGELPQGHLRVPFLSGAHVDTRRKLAKHWGIPTELYEVTDRSLGPVDDDEDWDLYREIFLFMTSQARITPKYLEKAYLLP